MMQGYSMVWSHWFFEPEGKMKQQSSLIYFGLNVNWPKYPIGMAHHNGSHWIGSERVEVHFCNQSYISRVRL